MHSSVQHLQRCTCVGSDYRSFVVPNRRNIQNNFFDKKRSKKKKVDMRNVSRLMGPKYTIRVEETNFRTGTMWYYFVDVT